MKGIALQVGNFKFQPQLLYDLKQCHRLKWAQPPPKISFYRLWFLKHLLYLYICRYIHTHTHAGKMTCLCPHSPQFPHECHHICSVLWQVTHVDLLDTKEPRSHFGIGQSVSHDTSPSCKQICSRWCIGSFHVALRATHCCALRYSSEPDRHGPCLYEALDIVEILGKGGE